MPVLATVQGAHMPFRKALHLPLSSSEKSHLETHAELSFDTVMETFQHPDELLIRALWNAEAYLERWPFRDVKPPIDLEYGLLLIEVFMPHHVLELLEILRIREDSEAN